jgi:hypothetical protein
MPSQTTRDHEEIQRWAQERGACPAVVSRTGGMLRFEFDPKRAEELTAVDWDEFFTVFDRKGLELVYDDKPGSRFHKIVYPETVQAKARRQPAEKPARAGTRINLLAGKGGAGRSQSTAPAGRGRGAAAGRSAVSSRGGGAGSRGSGGSRAPRATSTRAKSRSRAAASGKTGTTRSTAGRHRAA